MADSSRLSSGTIGQRHARTGAAFRRTGTSAPRTGVAYAHVRRGAGASHHRRGRPIYDAIALEPCGLNQMYSLLYGTPPVVHSIGGLKDTVFDADEFPMDQANGFSFNEPTPESFLQALRRALNLYQDPAHWQRLQVNGMKVDYSWQHSARAYMDVYDSALEQRTAP